MGFETNTTIDRVTPIPDLREDDVYICTRTEGLEVIDPRSTYKYGRHLLRVGDSMQYTSETSLKSTMKPSRQVMPTSGRALGHALHYITLHSVTFIINVKRSTC